MNISTQSKAIGLLVIVAVLAIALFAIVALAPTAQAATFGANLKQGSTGADVMELQKALNMNAATQVSASGAGSPGNETSYFGAKTKAAVIKYQELYASEILAPVGLTKGTGFVGPSTRAKLSGGGTTTTTSTVAGCTSTAGYSPTTGQKCDATTTTVVGGGLSVSAGIQPGNSLAPQSASRVPFTTIKITNGSTAATTVTGIAVERVGLAQDAVLSGIVLVDSASNTQIGTAKTLNSNHQATIGETFTINAGETKTLTIAGNMAASLSSYSGQVVGINVIAINTSSTVSGSLPISGASHTVNNTLSLGSVSTTTSSFDPGAAQTKNIGDSAVRFAGLRFTAGSSEDLRLYSVRWRQVGTASSVDIGNIMTVVEGSSYPTTVSADGKYYTTSFAGGLLIVKGNSVDMYIKGDLIGTNSASRTVDFDLDKVTDVYFVGQLYGYGIAPSGTYQPWYTGYATTINAGSATTIGKATEVPAQNIAVNVPNQVLGGFVTDFKGEAVSVTSLPITIATTSGFTGAGVITGISIVNSNGVVVAGPLDEASTATDGSGVTFTDTITFPVGRNVYTIKGKINSSVTNNSTVVVTTVPTSWSGITGQTSGNTITLTQGSFAMNTMTVKAAALTASMSTQPSSQNVVAGSQNVLFGNMQLDATQSGEDIRMSSIPATQTGTITNLSSCQLYSGATALNTGGNVPSALAASGSATTFTFDNILTIPKGTVTTLAIKCNLGSATSGTHVWSIGSGAMTATGVTSGVSVNVSETATSAGTMTIASGSLTVTVDSSSPSYAIAAGGATGVTAGVVKFRAANEAITLNKLGLTLTATSGSGNKSSDLVNVYIYDGSTLVGTATFTGTLTSATSTLTTPVTLPKDTDKTLTIKADFADIGTGQAGTPGDLVKIDPINAEGSGASSGTTIQSGATAGVAGVRLFNTFPTLGQDSLSGTGVADGKLLRFKVTANSAGPVGLIKFVFNVSTTTLSLSNIGLYAYTDAAYSTSVSDSIGDGSGQVNTSLATSTSACTSTSVYDTVALSSCRFASSVSTYVFRTVTNALQVPAGATRYFELRSSVTGATTGASAVVTLQSDTSMSTSTATGLLGTVSVVTNKFVWSPNSTTTANMTTDDDWTNGFNIVGFPASGITQARSN